MCLSPALLPTHPVRTDDHSIDRAIGERPLHYDGQNCADSSLRRTLLVNPPSPRYLFATVRNPDGTRTEPAIPSDNYLAELRITMSGPISLAYCSSV